jgi:hypothetical protein
VCLFLVGVSLDVLIKLRLPAHHSRGYHALSVLGPQCLYTK